jgi:hypothetical protein
VIRADAGKAGENGRFHVVLFPPEKRIATGIDFRWCGS